MRICRHDHPESKTHLLTELRNLECMHFAFEDGKMDRMKYGEK